MVAKIQKSIANDCNNAETKIETDVEALQKQIDDCIAERKILMRQCARETLRHPEREEDIQETYDELILEIDKRIDGLRNQLHLCQSRDSTVEEVSRIAQSTFDIFDEFISKEKLDKCDLDFLINGRSEEHTSELQSR